MAAYKLLIRANDCDATTYHKFLPSVLETLFAAGQDDCPGVAVVRRILAKHGHLTHRYSGGGIRWMIEKF